MQNFLIILVAVLFLITMWVVTYRNILTHSLKGASQGDAMIRSIFAQIHDKLPYILEVLKDHKIYVSHHGQEITGLRKKLLTKEASIIELFEAYGKIQVYLEKIFTVDTKGIKADVGFWESKAELQDLHDELRLRIRDYNAHANDYNAKLIKFPGNLVASLFRMPAQRELQ